jgi:type I restriction enzyme S subunit
MRDKINVPKHWQQYTFQEIGIIINGDRGKNYPSRAHYVKSGVPFISAGNIEGNFIDTNNLNFIKQQKYEALNNGKLEKGDIIYCLRGSLGKCAISNLDKGAISSSLCILRLNNNTIGKFVYYYLCSPFGRNEILKHDNGTAQPNLSAKSFSNFLLYCPPILEQHAIVSRIEELFSDLENGKKQLQTSQLLLNVYRQSLLKAAFEGKLTNKNVKDGELPKEWKRIKVSGIAKVVRGGSPRPAGDPRFYNGNIPFLKVRDLTKDKSTYLTTFEYTIKQAGLHKTRQIQPNTLLLSNSGATLGIPKICMIDATLNDGIAAFLNLDKRSNLYLYYFWLSKTEELRNINMGAAQPNLNTNIIKNYLLPWCSFEEQQYIVSELESKLTVCYKIEETINQSLQQAETLRQSILKNAFEGKLV